MDDYKQQLLDDIILIASKSYPRQSKRTIDILKHGDPALIAKWQDTVIDPLVSKHNKPLAMSRQYHMMLDQIITALNAKRGLSESIDTKQMVGQFREFILHCQNELDLDSLPKITWFTNDDVGTEHPSFGSFHNDDQTIKIGINNRHPLDIMRTLAHELCHYRQWSKDQLHDNSGDTGSDQENEANAVAGVIMRNWNQAHPEMFGQAPIERGKVALDESTGYAPDKPKTKTVLKYGIFADGPLVITDHFLERIAKRGLSKDRMARLIVVGAAKYKQEIAELGPVGFAIVYRNEPGGIAINKTEQVDGSFKYYITTVHPDLKTGYGQSVFKV